MNYNDDLNRNLRVWVAKEPFIENPRWQILLKTGLGTVVRIGDPHDSESDALDECAKHGLTALEMHPVAGT